MRPSLDLRHLEMIRALAGERTLAEAAEALRVTPSALSHRIREAERRLGAALYRRQGRVLRPTVAAEILANAAERLLGDMAQAERLAAASAGGVQHVIRLTVGTYNSYHWLPDFLAAFRTAHPAVDIDIEANAVLRPFESLAAEQIDIAITPGMVLPGPLEAVRLFTDELVAVTAPDHPFCARAFVEPGDFAAETSLTYSMVRQPGFEWDRFWMPANVSAARDLRIGSVEAICELVKAGFGVSILSRWALQPHFAAGTLGATRLGPEGIDIPWHAVLRGNSAEDAPERIVARALADWFGGASAR